MRLSATGLLLLMLVGAGSARADVLMPFDGECPPGSRLAVQNHAEVCIPIACGTDADSCPFGSTCRTFCVCRAEREFTNDGRVVFDEPVRRVVEIGLCDASGACREGEVAQRSQCEPNRETDAFDPVSHRWTGRTHRGCGGCTVGAAPRGEPFAWLGLVALLLWRRR